MSVQTQQIIYNQKLLTKIKINVYQLFITKSQHFLNFMFYFAMIYILNVEMIEIFALYNVGKWISSLIQIYR